MSQRFWSPLAAGLTPYVPGEQPRHDLLLKLNTNENPYPPSPRVLEAIASVSGEMLSRYPDPDSTELCATAASHFGLQPEQVFAGNGSDEILAHSFAAFFGGKGRLQFPDITYSFYPVWCELYGVSYECVPLRDDFSVAPEDFDVNAAAALLPNPNAPTGAALPRSAIEEMLRGAPNRLLVVDEAYVDFGGESAIPLIADYDNLLVVQTLSKSRALAGLRLGFAFGQAPLIEALRRVKDSFNSYPVDCLAQRAGIAALQDTRWFEGNCARVIQTRDRVCRGLEDLGFEVVPSAANFLFAQHVAHRGADLFAALRERGVLLRRWDRPRIENYIRISIGTEEQGDRLLTIFAEVLDA